MAIEINRNIHLLLAEKNPEVRGGLGAALRMHGYKNVDETSDYQDVISAVSQGEIDLLVTDATLEEEDITDLLYKIRHHQFGNNPFLAAIMLTADHTSKNINNIINSGADDILAKPLAPNLLINRIDILTWKRKGFIVTSDYFGPNRREITRLGPQPLPIIDVPNALKYKAQGKTNMAVLQRQIDACAKEVNSQKMERHTDQIGQLIGQITPQYENFNANDNTTALIERLQYVSQDLCRRMIGTDKEHVSELGSSIIQVVKSILKSPLSPENKDVRLLKELGSAIGPAFNAEDHDLKFAADISASVSNRAH